MGICRWYKSPGHAVAGGLELTLWENCSSGSSDKYRSMDFNKQPEYKRQNLPEEREMPNKDSENETKPPI